MKHEFIQHLPFCRHCGLAFQEHKEFNSICPGQLVEDAGVTPPPTPLPIGADLPVQPVARLGYALHQATELARDHYESAHLLGQAEGRDKARVLRAMAKDIARYHGVDPDAMVIAPGQLPRLPKGAVMIGFHLFKMTPYWCLFLADAMTAYDAFHAAMAEKEKTDGE